MTRLTHLLPVLVASLLTVPAPTTALDESDPRPAAEATVHPPASVTTIVIDDFSMDLLPLMPVASRFAAEHASFTRAFVTDSLCCTSRASIFTGMHPHSTGVRSNEADRDDDPTNDYDDPVGGWPAFTVRGNTDRTYAASVDAARPEVRTGLVGKFLNQYPVVDGTERLDGFDWWSPIGGGAYDGWNFTSVTDPTADGPLTVQRSTVGGVTDDAGRDALYAATAIQDDTEAFYDAVGETSKTAPDEPYQLTVAPYATHGRIRPIAGFEPDERAYVFPPAFRDRPGRDVEAGNCGTVDCRDLDVSYLAGWGRTIRGNQPTYADGTPAPDETWRVEFAGQGPARSGRDLRERAMMAQTVDRLLAEVLDRVDTSRDYVVLTADNGFHLGQHGRNGGKGTAYDHDVRVPLIVAGPGVVPGAYTDVVSTVDLAPTLEDVAGVEPPAYREGRSLLPLLESGPVSGTRPGWRDAVVIEHGRGGVGPDIDAAGIPRYTAVRTRDELLVRYAPAADDSAPTYELYDGLDVDRPYEADNLLLGGVSRDERELFDDLRRRLKEFETCTGSECFAP